MPKPEDVLRELMNRNAPCCHPSLQGVPDQALGLMEKARVLEWWWIELTPPIDRGMAEVRVAIEQQRERVHAFVTEAQELLKRFESDQRFPSMEICGMVVAIRSNQRDAFSAAKYRSITAFQLWRPKRHGGGPKPHHAQETLQRVLQDWKGARGSGIEMKEWAQGFFEGLGRDLGINPPPKGHEYSAALRLLESARKRISRKRRGHKA
jgi:hypothetical protein